MKKDQPKFTAKRCVLPGDEDDVNAHDWKPEAVREMTEQGPITWWECSFCPARTMYDAETEDGFADVPIVVYSASCFEGERACGCPRRASGAVEHLEGCVDEDAVTEALARQSDSRPCRHAGRSRASFRTGTRLR